MTNCALLISLVICGIPQIVTARTWSVPADIPTIQAAIDTSSEGDSVAVSAGTYHERLALIGKNIALLGVSGSSSTFLSGALLNGDSLSIFTIDLVDSTTLIQGFTFEDNGGDSARYTFGGAILCDFDGSPTIQNNIFRNNFADQGGAICVFGSSPGPTIWNNVFLQNTAFQGGGINVFGAVNMAITNNVFEGNNSLGLGGEIGTGGGVHIRGLSGITVDSNVFYQNEAGYGGALSVKNGAVTIAHNTLVFNRSTRVESGRAAGIRIDNVFAITNVANNIVALNKNGWGISSVGNTDPLLSCNDFWQNDLGNYSSVEPGVNDFSKDPLFCDPSSNNFTLGAASPCLPESTGGCGLIGALDVGCSEVVGINHKETAHSVLKIRAIHIAAGVKFVLQGRALAKAETAIFQIFDVQGRLVHSGEIQTTQRVAEYTWRRKNLAGNHVVPGVYFARVIVGAEIGKTSFVLRK